MIGTLGILGYGNMGAAIAEGLIAARTIAAAKIVVFEPEEQRRELAVRTGAAVAATAAALAGESDTLLLAVKPQVMAEALDALGTGFRPQTLVISIAAGIPISAIQEKLGNEARVVRVMPNTPAMVRSGAAAITLGPGCTEEDGEVARSVFDAVGITVMVAEEDMDPVTALSGSGPAYFFYFVECLMEAAVQEGLDRDVAARLAAQTLLGAGRLLQESGQPAARLREQVTSKGGTTAAALEAFRAAGFSELVAAGVHAAAARSRALREGR